MNCNQIKPHLDRIWQLFRQEGITDDLTIIEILAYFLLGEKKNFWEDHIQQRGPLPDQSKIDYALKEAYPFAYEPIFPRVPDYDYPTEKWGSVLQELALMAEHFTLGALFNDCIISHIQAMRAGGRYPTPRHIVALMASLAKIQRGFHIADLACGSGAMLVATTEKQLQVTGVEISANWARIAWANVVLHDFHDPEILSKNTYALAASSELDERFDRIVMNPPFGEKVDRSYFSYDSELVGGRSETAFTQIGLKALKPGGRMVILIPAGLLFATSVSEGNLKKSLLVDNHIEALVSLPDDTFQPYSGLKTYLLVVDKPDDIKFWEPDEGIWFYDVRHDGFSSGRNRQPEPEQSELPCLEGAILIREGDPDLMVYNPEGENLLYAYISEKKDSIRLATHTSARLKVSQLRGAKPSPVGFLAEARDKYTSGYCLYFENAGYIGRYLGDEGKASFSLEDFSTNSEKPGIYNFVDEEFRDYQIVVKDYIDTPDESLVITFHRKQIRFQSFTDESDVGTWQSTILLIDENGYPISHALWTEEKLSELELQDSDDYISIYEIQTEDDKPSGWLLVSTQRTIDAIKLTGESSGDGSTCFLVEQNNGYLLCYRNVLGQFDRIVIIQANTAFTGEDYHTGVIVDPMGNWFGIRVPTNEIREQGYNLQPSNYFPREEVSEPIGTPAEILADIKLKQIALNMRVDYLLGIIEQKAIPTRTPPEFASQIAPFGTLTSTQQRIWEEMQSFVDEINSDQGSYLTPSLFQPEDLYASFDQIDVDKTIELFLCMGVIIPVTIEKAPYYRLITAADIRELP